MFKGFRLNREGTPAFGRIDGLDIDIPTTLINSLRKIKNNLFDGQAKPTLLDNRDINDIVEEILKLSPELTEKEVDDVVRTYLGLFETHDTPQEDQQSDRG
jgi:hypothetical protein